MNTTGHLSAAFEAKARDLMAAQSIPIKDLRLLNGRTFTATFHGEASARKAASLLARVLSDVAVYSGFDPGKTTGLRNGLRGNVRVWRIRGVLRA